MPSVDWLADEAERALQNQTPTKRPKRRTPTTSGPAGVEVADDRGAETSGGGGGGGGVGVGGDAGGVADGVAASPPASTRFSSSS